MADRQGIEIETYLGGKLKEMTTNITVVVDDVVHKVPFGRPFIETAAGEHRVSVYWRLQFKSGRAETSVTVPVGGVVRLRWDGPRFIWQPAKLTVSG